MDKNDVCYGPTIELANKLGITDNTKLEIIFIALVNAYENGKYIGEAGAI